MYRPPTNEKELVQVKKEKLVQVKTEAVKLYFEVAHANAPLAPLHERIMNLGGFSYTGEQVSDIAQKDLEAQSIELMLLNWLFGYYKGFLEEVKGAMLHTRASYAQTGYYKAYHADDGWSAYAKKRDGSTTSKAKMLLSVKWPNREKKSQILAFFDNINKRVLNMFNPFPRGNVGIARELYRDYTPQLTALIESTKEETEAAKSLVDMFKASSSNHS